VEIRRGPVRRRDAREDALPVRPAHGRGTLGEAGEHPSSVPVVRPLAQSRRGGAGEERGRISHPGERESARPPPRVAGPVPGRGVGAGQGPAARAGIPQGPDHRQRDIRPEASDQFRRKTQKLIYRREP